jgi:hypothetical protein
MTMQQFNSAYDLLAFEAFAGFYWAWCVHKTWWGRLIALILATLVAFGIADDLKWN